MSKRRRQQEAVLTSLQTAKGPLTARELWKRLSAEGIGLATIYRALKHGVEDGSLVTVEVSSGGIRYEPKGRAHHHHFLCSKCDQAFDLEGCVDNLASLLPENFRMTRHEVVLFGTCEDCGEAA